jgi:PAS domain S-box-containing protein
MSEAMADFIRQRREDILQAWEGAVRGLPAARELTRPALRDHLPQMLERIARLMEHPAEVPMEGALEGLPDVHALERLSEGFDLRQVVTEYRVLRNVVLRLWDAHSGQAPRAARIFQEALDEAIAVSVTRYSRTRERTLQALNRISDAALGSADVAAFLPLLLQVLRETVEPVDVATVLLREGETLRASASVGLEEALADGFRVRLGEGFAGLVAERREPLLLAQGSADPRVLDPRLRAAGLTVLYGVPLLLESEVLGVAYMGSRTAHEFSTSDKLLFRTMAAHATGLLAQAQSHARERAARAQAEASVAALRESEARLDAVLEQLPAGVLIAHVPDGRLARVNRQVGRLLGESLAAVGSVADVAHLDGRHPDGRPYAPGEWPLARSVRDGEVVAGEEVGVRRADGRRLTLSISSAPIRDAHGRALAAVATLFDVTERRAAEDAARRAAQFGEQLIGMVSHDLRNPLNAISLSAAQLLMSEDLAPAHQRALARMAKAAERMRRMIEELLDLTRSRLGGGIPLTRRSTDLAEVARQALDELEAAHPERTLALDVAGDCRGEWDPERLAQVVSNLVGNALRYSPPDSPVQVRVGCAGAQVELAVHNGGEPIPPEALATLFEPFRRATEHGSGARGGGLGLGLHIVEQVVRAHGGDLEVASSQEDGTTFRVRLPTTPPVPVPR